LENLFLGVFMLGKISAASAGSGLTTMAITAFYLCGPGTTASIAVLFSNAFFCLGALAFLVGTVGLLIHQGKNRLGPEGFVDHMKF